MQMLASVALEVLMEVGDSRDNAAQKVASRVSKWPGMYPPYITATTIRNWRDQQRSKAKSARSQFQKLRAYILKQPDPRAEIDRLLKEGPPGVPKS
jgi:hypothetical protein